MGIPDHFTCLLRNLYAGQEATKPNVEQQTGSKLEKQHDKAVYCHLVYLAHMQSTSCKMLGWVNQTGIKIAGRNINKLSYADDTTLIAEIEEPKTLDENERLILIL